MASKEDISGAPLSVKAVFLRPDELHTWAFGRQEPHLLRQPSRAKPSEGAHTRRCAHSSTRALARGWADVLGVVSIFTCGLRRELGHSAAAGASSTRASETWTWTSLLMLLWTRIALWRRTRCVCRVPR